MRMPIVSGYDALAELRTRYSRAELPIVALTAAALLSEQERCMGLGADEFITKPIDADKLLSTLLSVAARCAARRAGTAGG
jgi:CheY-like chemotaxis protein